MSTGLEFTRQCVVCVSSLCGEGVHEARCRGVCVFERRATQRKGDGQQARRWIVIKNFSLVKLATARNRWRGSASNTNEPETDFSFSLDGTSMGKIIKKLMASINQYTEKHAAGVQNLQTKKTQCSWNQAGLNSIYGNYTFSKTLIRKWETPWSDQLHHTIIPIYSAWNCGKGYGWNPLPDPCWFHKDENNSFAVLHYKTLMRKYELPRASNWSTQLSSLTAVQADAHRVMALQ